MYWQDDFDKLAGVWQDIQKKLSKSQHDLTNASPIPTSPSAIDRCNTGWLRVQSEQQQSPTRTKPKQAPSNGRGKAKESWVLIRQ